MHDEKPVKLAAKLPKGDNLNGLDTVHDRLRKHGTAYLIMQVTAPTVTDHLGGIQEPRAEIEWVEGLPTGDGGSLGTIGAKLLEVARAQRLGEGADTLFGRHGVLVALRDHLNEIIEATRD